jgi:branched-chain amino acid transport system ATP-binding protein
VVSALGTTIVLVEQTARLALQAAHRGYVMDSGLVTLHGEAAQLLEDPKVRAAYLGEEGAAAGPAG